MTRKPFIHQPLVPGDLTYPVYCKVRTRPSDTIYPAHSHLWGEFVYSFSGVIELQVAGALFRVPPDYGLWLPPGAEHEGFNRYESLHCSLYLEPEFARAKGLPSSPCALTMNTMLRAMLDYLKSSPPELPYTGEYCRLLEVITDQLGLAPCAGSYLPVSDDMILARVLSYLEDNPGDNCSVRDLAVLGGTTERTLARKARNELGMPLSEWRQRLKVMHAMPMLTSGDKVESVALDLGYSTASAFIAMFRKLVGVTPDEYRKRAD